LKTTLDRVLPYWNNRLAPELMAGRDVLVVAHGNSLRALVKMLDGMSAEDIVEFNIPTGVPIHYQLDESLKATSRRFLGDPEAIKAATVFFCPRCFVSSVATNGDLTLETRVPY
jgi:2,3-bisphosphoglycerate-dependent phosphoglycerate mutase